MTMLVDGLSDFVASVGSSLVTKATLTLLLTLGAVRVARRARASVRHLLLMAGFGVLLALPVAMLFGPSVRVDVAPVAVMLEEYLDEAVFLDETGPVDAAPFQSEAAATAHGSTAGTATLIAAIWFAGLLLCGSPLVVGLVQVGRLRRTALPWREGQRLVDRVAHEAGVRRNVDVLRHESVAAPATCGFGRHAILFPVDADRWAHEDILRATVHEVEHVRRADCLVNAVARAICAAYWFHPLAWVAWRRLGLEAERACDDAVLRRAEAEGYADQLVTLAGRLSAGARHPLLAMANRSDLVQRVTAVLDREQARGHAGVASGVVIAIAASAVIVTLSPLQAVSASPGVATTQSASGDVDVRFEVATIRINRSGERRARHSIVPASGQLTITNISVSALIQEAYGVPLASQLINVPDWADRMRVDVVAKSASPAPVATLQRMLQPLLAEHFELVVRREPREMDVFAMVVDTPGRLGPRLRSSEDACDDAIGTAGGFARAPEGAQNGTGTCGILPGGAGRIVARGLDMPGLAAFIGTVPGRMVIDRTGLSGRFDIDLTYTPSAFTAEVLAQRPGAAPPPGVDPSGPPLVTALREQLGLRLEPVRASVEVLVIERAVPLTADARDQSPVTVATTKPDARAAQNPSPSAPATFEVASIRRNTSGGVPRMRVEGGRFVASNTSLVELVRDAYRLQSFQVVGGPEWVRAAPGPTRAAPASQRPGEVTFDIIARIPPDMPPAQVPAMVRTLLMDRFNLVAHTEMRDMPVYVLTYARDDRRLGPNLTPSTLQCQAEVDGGPLRAPATRVSADGKPVCGMTMGPARIRGGGLTLPFLANALTGFTQRVVVDRTGLEGAFDFDLTYAPAVPRGGGPAPSGDRPSIFTAVQEQLGLKLEPATAPVDVLVIDSVSMPTEN